MKLRAALLLSLTLLFPSALLAQPLTPETQRKIDVLLRTSLEKYQTPSASIAIIQDGHLAYAAAYGQARLQTATSPAVAATPDSVYPIASISKQFTAAAILLLQEDGKLSLDDKVAKYFPDLTRAADITLRQLLSHTAGYQDFWPEDYLPPLMAQPVMPQYILDHWAKKPLDYEPGTQWQYSNTGYTIAGLIVEKVSGRPLHAFLASRIFTPLKMSSALSLSTATRTGPTDPAGYTSYALGPIRPCTTAGQGWLFSAGDLAMTASDLARWNQALMHKEILKPESWAAMQTSVPLISGEPTGYGLGLMLSVSQPQRRVEHGGEDMGFISNNLLYPDQGLAITILTNSDTTDLPRSAANAIAQLLLPHPPARTAEPPTNLEHLKVFNLFTSLQSGRLDRSLLTPACNFYFSDAALTDFTTSLAPLGPPITFIPQGQSLRGGMKHQSYLLTFADHTRLSLSVRTLPDGQIHQYQISRP